MLVVKLATNMSTDDHNDGKENEFEFQDSQDRHVSSSTSLNSDKVRMYEETMTNDDNLDSNLLTSSLLKTSGLHAGTS